ncbi:MAG: hypothetical protein V9G20_28480 [Candidatus Promineifilaceae bacterium]
MKLDPSSIPSGRRIIWLVAVVAILLVTLACGGSADGNTSNANSGTNEPTATDAPAEPTATFDLSFTETFDSLGNWASEANKEVSGNVSDGVYVFNLIEPNGFYWATADKLVGGGTYEVTTTAVSGPINNGYGMMINVDNATDSFIALEISSDGFASVYSCESACEDLTYLVSDGWFQTPAIQQGLNSVNILKIQAASFGQINFYVNDQQVGQVDNQDLILGDIAVFVESFDEGNVIIHFDDFKFTP